MIAGRHIVQLFMCNLSFFQCKDSDLLPIYQIWSEVFRKVGDLKSVGLSNYAAFLGCLAAQIVKFG